jgi:hypothetical protein
MEPAVRRVDLVPGIPAHEGLRGAEAHGREFVREVPGEGKEILLVGSSTV